MRSRAVLWLSHSFWRGDSSDAGALTIPVLSGELATPDQLHHALFPAWESLVEDRNNAGLVGPKEEGKPQPKMSKDETVFQYNRVQQGEVDSARLLLVFGMVPSTRHMDSQTMETLMQDQKSAGETSDNAEDSNSANLPAVLDPELRYADGSTPLHMAASFGLVDSIRHFAKAGADVSVTAATGIQPIHNAAIMGHTAAVESLVELGANPNAQHGFAQSTPMHFAAEMGHPGVVKRLCELGAEVEAEKRHGGTPIHITADTNNAAVTRVLVEAPCGADPDSVLLGDTVPLYLAAGRGFHEVIEVLLDAGADPDRTLWPERPWQKKKRRKGRKTPESKEIQVKGNPAHNLPGSDPNSPGWEAANGATALHNACENGHRKAAIALLDGGALQLATMEGVTPLIIALQYRHPDIAAGLLDHWTPANIAVASPADGQTALHIAAAYDYPEVVARIMREGGTTNVWDKRGNLPVNYARGDMTRWVLGRFQGREPKLDAAVRKNRGKALTEILSEVKGVPADAKRLYTSYAHLYDAGELADEAGRLAQQLSSKSTAAGDREDALQRFAVARFLLAGGDAPLAVEAVMKKTKAAVAVGLALLNIRVDELEYNPGHGSVSEVLKINGRDALASVNAAVQAALRSAEQGNADEFEQAVAEVRDIAAGRRKSDTHTKGVLEGDSAAESDGEGGGDQHLDDDYDFDDEMLEL